MKYSDKAHNDILFFTEIWFTEKHAENEYHMSDFRKKMLNFNRLLSRKFKKCERISIKGVPLWSSFFGVWSNYTAHNGGQKEIQYPGWLKETEMFEE